MIGAPIIFIGPPISFIGCPILFIGRPTVFIGVPISFVGRPIVFIGEPAFFGRQARIAMVVTNESGCAFGPADGLPTQPLPCRTLKGLNVINPACNAGLAAVSISPSSLTVIAHG